MKNMLIEFVVTDVNSRAVAYKEEKETLSVVITDGKIEVSVYYDFKEVPLTLVSEVLTNDKVSVVLLPHRIELRVNNEVRDEDWPAGNRLFNFGDVIEGDIEFNISDYVEEETEQPSVIYTFKNAQGWQPSKDVNVGDCMPYVNDGRYHVLYLKDRRHHCSKWVLGAHQWEHISTSDFIEWQVHPMAVPITEWYEGSICTGSWIKHGDTQYLYYTVRMYDRSPAHICRSISKDGYHFKKDKDFCFKLSDKYLGRSVRDPKVILGDDGLYHMFLTTTLVEAERGCLAHLVSSDLNEWTELDTPIYISDDATEPECPDYIKYGGYYYLIFSLKTKAHYMISKSAFDGFKLPENPIIPCSSVPKGAVWNGKIVFTGFIPTQGYAGVMTFKTATNDKDGILIFE